MRLRRTQSHSRAQLIDLLNQYARLPQQLAQLLALLKADQIEIALSEEDQLDTEQSTSAIVVHHPQAKYFSV